MISQNHVFRHKVFCLIATDICIHKEVDTPHFKGSVRQFFFLLIKISHSQIHTSISKSTERRKLRFIFDFEFIHTHNAYKLRQFYSLTFFPHPKSLELIAKLPF